MAVDQAKLSALAGKQLGNDKTDLQYQVRGHGQCKVKRTTGETLISFEREKRLLRYGHIKHSRGSVRPICDTEVVGMCRPCREAQDDMEGIDGERLPLI